MTPDQYTTTADPLRDMQCEYCLGLFVGTTATNQPLFNLAALGPPFRGTKRITICDSCLKAARDA